MSEFKINNQRLLHLIDEWEPKLSGLSDEMDVQMKNQIIADIRQTLIDSADEKIKTSSGHFFKEEIKVYGVKTAEVTKIGKFGFQQIKHLPKQEIFELCEELWKSGYSEEAFIACNWSDYLHKQYKSDDFKVFEHWVNEYVTNWATCDTLCNHTIGTNPIPKPKRCIWRRYSTL
ncbi:MAG: DNA alkylation repair protein [Massilibacteroides sp.]|nr:DNA alkylation repair protein [Massilibacteroides sp.]MDD3061370.1 DNA alkylation repair protein [Massilibacteroides sp.]MDD4114887.1 DNA alkylation repair protein [Massilibacteroides sp.]MDD4659461.1 DNA alkylation repair protein [Massilibacteroides sp.]